MAAVAIDHVVRRFGHDKRTRPAVDDITLDVADGEFLVLVGPSGCGKTTLLRIIAGLEDLTSGEIRVDGQPINGQRPRERNVAMVFQNYALYAHLSVRDNLAFPLRQRKMAEPYVATRVATVAESMGLTELLDRKPGKLSGGQRQRVAMGRAVVRDPTVFLMDEPLSNLDATLRVRMRVEVMRIQRELGATTIYVTHDQVEAMTMGDRVAVLADGALQQCGTPEELYRGPGNLFVARFIGSPAMNIFTGTITGVGCDGLVAQIGRHAIPLPIGRPSAGLTRRVGRPLLIGVRPQDLVDPVLSQQELPTVAVRVELVENLGSERIVHFRLDGAELARTPWDRHEVGEPAHLAVATLPSATTAKAGQDALLAIRPEHLHFFDPETGATVEWT